MQQGTITSLTPCLDLLYMLCWQEPRVCLWSEAQQYMYFYGKLYFYERPKFIRLCTQKYFAIFCKMRWINHNWIFQWIVFLKYSNVKAIVTFQKQGESVEIFYSCGWNWYGLRAKVHVKSSLTHANESCHKIGSKSSLQSVACVSALYIDSGTLASLRHLNVVWGFGRRRKRRSISSQECPIGDRSGALAGQGNTSTVFRVRYCCTDPAICDKALLCCSVTPGQLCSTGRL